MYFPKGAQSPLTLLPVLNGLLQSIWFDYFKRKIEWLQKNPLLEIYTGFKILYTRIQYDILFSYQWRNTTAQKTDSIMGQSSECFHHVRCSHAVGHKVLGIIKQEILPRHPPQHVPRESERGSVEQVFHGVSVRLRITGRTRHKRQALKIKGREAAECRDHGEDAVESDRPHGTNWSGLKLTEEKNGAERVRRGERERRRSVLGLRNSQTTRTGIPASLWPHRPGNTSAKDLPKREHKLSVITEMVTAAEIAADLPLPPPLAFFRHQQRVCPKNKAKHRPTQNQPSGEPAVCALRAELLSITLGTLATSPLRICPQQRLTDQVNGKWASSSFSRKGKCIL